MAEDEDLTNQLDSIQQQVNQQNAIKSDAETVIGSVSEPITSNRGAIADKLLQS